MTFKHLVLSIEYTENDRDEFVRMCSDWSLYCTWITRLTKLNLVKLIHYLIEERTKSNRLLGRAISRFNRLNALKKEDLM